VRRHSVKNRRGPETRAERGVAFARRATRIESHYTIAMQHSAQSTARQAGALFVIRFVVQSATSDVLTTPRITFKNIKLLPNYFLHRELLYDSQPRHIILSEQGFHTPAGTDGETIQAAAYAYAYKKIENIDGIDAFILHRHVDNPQEGGLLLGLRRGGPERAKKQIWDVFRAADTPEWESAFEFALPVVGLKSWSELATRATGQ
jgi:hypothetical protein